MTIKPRTPPGALSSAESRRRTLEFVRRMAPGELFELAVETGIYTPDGALRAEYGGSAPPVGRVPKARRSKARKAGRSRATSSKA